MNDFNIYPQKGAWAHVGAFVLSQESKLPCAVPATLRSITTAQLSLSGDHIIYHIACTINTITCCQAHPVKHVI